MKSALSSLLLIRLISSTSLGIFPRTHSPYITQLFQHEGFSHSSLSLYNCYHIALFSWEVQHLHLNSPCVPRVHTWHTIKGELKLKVKSYITFSSFHPHTHNYYSTGGGTGLLTHKTLVPIITINSPTTQLWHLKSFLLLSTPLLSLSPGCAAKCWLQAEM